MSNFLTLVDFKLPINLPNNHLRKVIGHIFKSCTQNHENFLMINSSEVLYEATFIKPFCYFFCAFTKLVGYLHFKVFFKKNLCACRSKRGNLCLWKDLMIVKNQNNNNEEPSADTSLNSWPQRDDHSASGKSIVSC